MDEVDVEAVDTGDELRQGIQLRLGFAPVVRLAPVLTSGFSFSSCTP